MRQWQPMHGFGVGSVVDNAYENIVTFIIELDETNENNILIGGSTKESISNGFETGWLAVISADFASKVSVQWILNSDMMKELRITDALLGSDGEIYAVGWTQTPDDN